MKQNKSQPKLKKTSRQVIEDGKVFKGIKNEETVHVRDKILSSVIDSMSDGLAVHELLYDKYGKAVDYILTEVNISFEKITGLKRDEIIGKPASEVYSVKKAPYLDIYSQVESSGDPATFETFFPPMKKYFSVSVFSPGKGKFATVFQDITERRIMEETLRESEKKYRELILHAPSGIYEVDFRTRMFTTVNDSMCLLTGYPREELLSMTAFEILDEAGRMAFQVRINKWLSGEKPDENVEYNVRAKDGHIICALLNVKFKTDKEGIPIGALVVAHDITERKKTVLALRESEDRFRTIAETIPALVCITRLEDSTVMFTNEYNNKAFGLKGEDIIGTIGPDYYCDPEDRLKMINLFSEKGFVDNYQLKVKKSDGSPFWIITSVRPIIYNNQPAIIGASIDITEYKKIEEELKKSEQLYRAIGESIDYGVWVCEPGGRNIYASESYLKLVGLTQEQCSSFGWGDSLHPDDADRTIAAWKECARTGGKWDIEHRFKGVDGKWHPILARGIPIRDEEGNITAWAGINLDIANLKLAEDRLMQTQEKLSVILENSNIGTWDWDLKSGEITIHEGARQILGIEPDKSVKTQEEFESLLHEEDIYHVQKAFNRTIEQGSPLDTIFRLKSDNRFISFKASLIKSNNKTPLLISGICFDVSDIKKSSEETLVKLSEELLRSNKELENFAYVASHDLQEPLRMVSSFTQLLAHHYKDKLDDRAQEYIYFAVDGAKRMYDLLNGLLAYSRIHTKGKAFIQVDVNRVMTNVIKNLALNINERGAVIKMDEMPVISADETQMIQLFQNLIANSIKFSPGFPKIYISSKLEEDQYIFSVKDEGIGIESQYFDKIFQIFQRLLPKEQYEGTGIGLAMCKRIIERHGGRIWVESEPGVGSTFYFTIPKNNEV